MHQLTFDDYLASQDTTVSVVDAVVSPLDAALTAWAADHWAPTGAAADTASRLLDRIVADVIAVHGWRRHIEPADLWPAAMASAQSWRPDGGSHAEPYVIWAVTHRARRRARRAAAKAIPTQMYLDGAAGMPHHLDDPATAQRTNMVLDGLACDADIDPTSLAVTLTWYRLLGGGWDEREATDLTAAEHGMSPARVTATRASVIDRLRAAADGELADSLFAPGELGCVSVPATPAPARVAPAALPATARRASTRQPAIPLLDVAA